MNLNELKFKLAATGMIFIFGSILIFIFGLRDFGMVFLGMAIGMIVAGWLVEDLEKKDDKRNRARKVRAY